MNIKLDEIEVFYIEHYLDGYSRVVYAIDADYMGFTLTISGIILNGEIELRDDLFDDIEVRTAIYQQFKDGELEVIIHGR